MALYSRNMKVLNLPRGIPRVVAFIYCDYNKLLCIVYDHNKSQCKCNHKLNKKGLKYINVIK